MPHRCFSALVRAFMITTFCFLGAPYVHAVQPCLDLQLSDYDCLATIQKDNTVFKVTPDPIFLREGKTITWDRLPDATGKKHKFALHLDCLMFDDVDYDQDHAVAAADLLPQNKQLRKCKYTIFADGQTLDPHVIIVGSGVRDDLIPTEVRPKKHAEPEAKH